MSKETPCGHRDGQRQSVLYGTLILTVATGFSKVIGALFKIPLARFLLDGEGMGYFSTAYELYLPMYAISMAGIPVAISRMVATCVGEGRYRDIRAIHRVARRAFLVTGLLGFAFMLLGALPFTLWIKQGDFSVLYSILAISPALLFCCIMSAYRGYYEGLGNMYPTAVSEVLDVCGKLVFGVAGALLVLEIGLSQYENTGCVFGQVIEAGSRAGALQALQPYAAAGAVFGVTGGSAASAIFLFFRHHRKGDGITPEQLARSPLQTESNQILRQMVKIAIPIVIGALANNIASLVDVLTVQQRLEFVVSRFEESIRASCSPALDGVQKIPDFLFGCYKGYSYSFYNLVPTIATVIGVSALPSVAAAWATKNRENYRRNMESVLRLTALVSFPGGIGLCCMGEPLMRLVFGAARAAEAKIAGELLVIQGLTAALAGLCLPLSSMLQAMGREKVPMYNILVGSLLKVGLNWYLVGLPAYHVKGAVMGSLACYGFMAVSNYICLCRYGGCRPNWWGTMGKPMVASGFCGLTALVLQKVLIPYVSEQLVTVIAIGAAAAVYVLSVGLLRVLRRDEVETLPKGNQIAQRLAKLHFLADN